MALCKFGYYYYYYYYYFISVITVYMIIETY